MIAGMPSNTVDLSALPGLPRRRPPSTSGSAPTGSSPRSTRSGSSSTRSTGWRCASSGSGWCASGCWRSSIGSTTSSCTSRPSGRGGSTPSTRRRRCSTGTSRSCRSASGSASSTSRRSSCRARRKGCSCTGTATTPRSASATARPPSAPGRRRRSSTASRSARMEDVDRHRRAAAVHRRLSRAVRRRPGRAGRAGLRPRVRRLPRRERAGLLGRACGQGDADRGDRHRPGAARQLHARPRGQPERALRRVWRRALPDLPQDPRLRQRAARRGVAAGALPAQRLGAGHGGAAVAAGGAAAGVPARLRRLRPADARLRQRPGPDRPGAARAAVLLRHRAPRRRRSVRRGRRR